MARLSLLFLVLMTTATATAEVSFSLHITGTGSAGDLAREARLAERDSPTGRAMHHVNAELAHLLRGGQPGVGAAPVLLFKVQGGQPLELISAAVDSGIPVSSQPLLQIPWPWLETEPETGDETDLVDQVGLALGQRLLLEPDRPNP